MTEAIKETGTTGQQAGDAASAALSNLTAHRMPALSPNNDYEAVDHPPHYGGKSDPFEPIKIIEALDLGFAPGSALKYLLRAGRKPGSPYVEDLKKAVWYLNREIERVEG